MTDYRRLRIPGGSYAFTLCLEARGSSLLTDRIDLLRQAWRDSFRDFPATVHAVVILPDHLHAVLTEAEGSVQFSNRWQRLKARFSHGIAERDIPRPSLARRREAGIWQRRFWEHALRDRAELDAAMAFCRTDPVRHGLVRDPGNWPYLTIRAPAWADGRHRPSYAMPSSAGMGPPSHPGFGPGP